MKPIPSRPSMSKKQAIAAIQARQDGVFDHPDLVRWGPLSTSEEQDCREIATQAGIVYTKPINSLRDLYDALNIAYNHPTDRWNAMESLYNEHFHRCVMAEGFTDAQARLIESKANEDGHSSGHSEVVLLAMDLVEFTQKLLAAK